MFDTRVWDGKWMKYLKRETYNVTMKKNAELVRQLETENKISADDERADLADQYPVLIKFMTSWAALHYSSLRERRFESEPETKLCVTQALVDRRPQYLRFMTEHTTSAAISGTDSVSKPLMVSRLIGLGHIDLCMLTHDQTDYYRPKLTRDKRHFLW